MIAVESHARRLCAAVPRQSRGGDPTGAQAEPAQAASASPHASAAVPLNLTTKAPHAPSTLPFVASFYSTLRGAGSKTQNGVVQHIGPFLD